MDLLELVELRPVLGDGAMGTMLQDRGLKMGDCPEAWNTERPEVVADIHSAYRSAGSDFVETNTFGANRIKLKRHGLDSRLDEIITAGVDLARRAVDDSCLIAGSVGPTGALLEPYGEVSPDAVIEAFTDTARLMEKAGVDFFLIETMTDPNEALLAIRAIKEASKKSILTTMAFSKGAKGYRTIMGTSPEQAASMLTEAGASLVGTNCCNGMPEAIEIMRDMVQVTPLASIAQPNAGLPTLESGKPVYSETPQAMAGGMESLLGMNVRIIGGCCGTTPAHIEEMGHLIGKC